jgi:hypothetical protein
MDLILGRTGSVRARAAVCVGGLLFVGFSLGCMNLSFGGRTQVVSPAAHDDPSTADGVQRGKGFVLPGQEVSVYYPVPYAQPPNLQFEETDKKGYLQIVDQKPDHFRVKNISGWNVDFPWKARGITVASTKAPATSGPPEATTDPAQVRGRP